jgi:hypothetical protein
MSGSGDRASSVPLDRWAAFDAGLGPGECGQEHLAALPDQRLGLLERRGFLRIGAVRQRETRRAAGEQGEAGEQDCESEHGSRHSSRHGR